MKHTLFLLAILLQSIFFGQAQTINVSTGVNASYTADEPIGNLEQHWVIASSPNPPGTPAKVCTYFSGYWEPTPIAPTYAGWINVAGNPYGYNAPGIYVFERDFAVPVGCPSFNYNFGITYDDDLVSLELVNPSGGTIPLTPAIPIPYYYLTPPVANTVLSPAAGTWKIRATVDFVDYVGGFMASGYVNVAPCKASFVIGLDDMGGTAPGIFDNPGGGYFATGLSKDATVIVKADASGNIAWIQKFVLGSGYYQIKDLKVDANGDLLGIASMQGSTYQSAIFKCDPTATTFSWIITTSSENYSQLHIVNSTDFIVTASNSSGFTQFENRDISTGSIAAYSLQGQGGDYYSTLDNGNLYGACRRYYNGYGDFRTSVFSHDVGSGAFQWQNAIISQGNTVLSTYTRMYPVAPAVDNPGNALAILSSGDLVGFDTYASGPVELVAAQTSQIGDVNWTMQYVIDKFDRPNAVAIKNTSTGYYIVACIYLPSLNDFGYTVVIKTDKDGKVQWARRLGISGRNIATSAVEKNGSLYLSLVSDSYNANELIMVKLNPQGNSDQDCTFINDIPIEEIPLQNIQDANPYGISTKSFNENNIGTNPIAISPKPVGYCQTACERKCVIIKGPKVALQGTKVKLTAEGEGIPDDYEWNTGETGQAIEVTESGIYCVKVVDANGNICEECHEIIFLTAEQLAEYLAQGGELRRTKALALPSLPSTITLSPNPAHSVITLKLGTALLAKANVNITDQYGRIVYQGVLPAGTKQTNLSIAHLPAAMYYVTIHTADKKSTTVRVIKQ